MRRRWSSKPQGELEEQIPHGLKPIRNDEMGGRGGATKVVPSAKSRRNFPRAKWFHAQSLTVAVAALLLPALCLAGKQFVMPQAQPAKTYPAHDEHPNEKVTVAVDPYDMADKASIFVVHYNEIGILPIFLVITNDSDQPISLSGMSAELVTVDRTKLLPDSADDLYRRLSHPSERGTSYPLPFPRRKVKGAVSKEQREEIENARFLAKAVEPHSSQSGFLFFDVSGISTPLAGAHFYLTDVHDARGNELMYFEIPLEKYLGAPARP
jgi:hypothetical protein